jgi:hypothetical protein
MKLSKRYGRDREDAATYVPRSNYRIGRRYVGEIKHLAISSATFTTRAATPGPSHHGFLTLSCYALVSSLRALLLWAINLGHFWHYCLYQRGILAQRRCAAAGATERKPALPLAPHALCCTAGILPRVFYDNRRHSSREGVRRTGRGRADGDRVGGALLPRQRRAA